MSAAEECSPGSLIAELITELNTFKTQFDVFRFMKRVTEIYGARAFIIFNLPLATSIELSSSSIINSWPAELLSSYDQGRLLANSPVIEHLRVSTLPLAFDFDNRFNLQVSQPVEAARDLFTRFNMVRGTYFPVHDAMGNSGAVALTGDRPPFTLAETMELLFLSVHVFHRLAAIRDLDNRATETLTDREVDCLNWTAAGKTSVEIAEILGLSEHTINHYLNRATKKLDTVNRTQAVAKALRIGLIK